jgi:uncharacterized Tic20 family protein
MPVTIVCPGCKAKLKAPDNLIGKTVKCPNCTKPVLVKAAAAVVPAPVPAPAKKPPVKRAPVVEEDPTEDMEPTEDMGPLEDQIPDEEEEVEARPKKRKRGSSSDSERSTASLIHMCTLINLVVPPVGLLVPIFLWIGKRKESAFVDHHGKTWLNFQISMFVLNLGLMFLFGALAGAGFFIKWWVGILFLVLLFVTLFGLSIYMLIMNIVAGMKAKKGDWFEYRVLFRACK